MSRGCRRFAGFTLVEVLVVLTVIGILIAVTIPNYLNARPQRFLSQTANNMAANLNFARTTAIKNNTPTYVEFLPEIDTYRVWDSQGWDQYAKPASGLSIAALPLKEVAPQLQVRVTPNSIALLSRNYQTERSMISYAGTPDEVDIRMSPYSCVGQARDNVKLISRNNRLSRDPLMFLKYLPDGRCVNSWNTPCSLSVTAIPRLPSPNLGFSMITLQVRGGFNGATALDFVPNTSRIGSGDINSTAAPYPNPSLTPNQTLPYEAAISEANGRRILINHANGRVSVENYAPFLIDVPDAEDDDPNFLSPTNNKEWI
ncbi:MAG: GspH/FimT family pseudopilin [bacterium]